MIFKSFVIILMKIKGFFPEIIVSKALEIGPKIKGTYEKVNKKGVKIAFGTDAGVYPHGENAKEFGYIVEAGMPEMKAIQSATITNTSVLRNQNIDKITVGKYANIIAVDANPTKNIKPL